MASSTILAVLATLALATCSVVNVSPKTAGAFELLILHNNDMHARFEQTSQLSGTCTAADRDAGKCYGGFPRVAHVVKEARKAAASGEGPPVLYLNAGDTYTGTAWFTIYKWKIAAEFLNALKPDAVSLGNHEFDNGVSGLTPFIENLRCPILAANLILSKEPTLLSETNLMNSLVIDINGTKVGVIGYLTPETKVLAIANNVEYIDEVVALQKEVYRLRNDSVNIIIALGHSGFARDLEIAKQVEGLDLVIGGHTNTFLWNGTSPDSESPEGPYPTLVKQKSGKQVPVVQAYAYTKYLGKFHMVFDSEGEIVSYDGNPILLDKTVPQDPDVLAVIYKYREAVNNISEVVVGKTSVVFDARLCKKKECNLGNLITDSMIYKYAKEYQGEGWTDAPMAVLQRGGIRSSIAPINLPAAVTTGDLLTVMPFDGHLVTLKINGSDIWKMLEHSVAKYTPAKAPGEFLQMSGIKVIYDLKKRPGMRVVKVTARCGMCDVPEYLVVNKTKEYKLLTTSFLAMGGDGYSIFKGLPIESLSYDELDATTLYLQTHSPVYTAVEDRITLYNVDKMKGNSAATKGLSLVSCLLALITFKFI